MDELQKTLLMQVADLHDVPAGAYNIRANGEAAGRRSTEHIEIVTKEDKPGIDIYIKPGTKRESVHIPVLMTQTGLKELVYNDFHIGEDCDVTIVAGCGIHNGGDKASEHSGIHTFYVGKNAKIRYVEKHYGTGEGLDGEDSSTNVISRSVAKDASEQMFYSHINGNNKCAGHSECDAIIMDNAVVRAIPEITANHLDASLIHEAAIGKIAGEQLIKLMTLGLTEAEAEEQIVNGFLK